MMTWDGDPNSADLSQYRGNLAKTGQEQARYNRPTTFGPFGQSNVGPDGSVTSSFSGGFGALNDNLTTQAADAAAHPMDWGQFGTLGTGQDAGRQASQAAYSQSLSRLNPFWNKSEKSLRTNLFQTGMGDSTAGDDTMDEFGRAKNDAYSAAMTGALRTGMDAQQSAFGGNLASRQQNVANALRGQTQAFEELGGMQGFLAQPQVGADNSMMVRDAGFNQLAPVTAWADKEKAITQHADEKNPGLFDDSPEGQRRKRAYETLTPEQREFYANLSGRGGRLQIDPGNVP
jgi:hypothetical protein